MQSLPLYTSCLLSMALNDNIVDTEKPYEIYSPTFLVNDFSGLFLHPSVVYLFSMNGDNSNNKNHYYVLLSLTMQIFFYCKIMASFSVWNH